MTYVLDGGQRFGRSQERFHGEYFFKLHPNAKSWEPRESTPERLSLKLKDMVYVIPESDKRESMPEPVYHEIMLPEQNALTKSMIVELIEENMTQANGSDISAVNGGVLSGKLRQLAQGFIYNDDGTAEIISDERFQMFTSFIDDRLTDSGQPMVITYEFAVVGEALAEAYPEADMINGDTTEKQLAEIKAWWRAGKGKLLLMQVKAGSHGLDGLQFSSHVLVNYAPIWSRDATIQLTGRLDRTGQTEQGLVYTCICSGSVDEEVMDRVEGKAAVFKEFLKHVDTGDRLS
jgi:SNF2 family DNA or RNA helicase